MDASFTYDDGSYCVGDANPVPTITGDTTGSFTSSTALAIDASSGAIDIASSNVGDYLVSYIVGNSNCARFQMLTHVCVEISNSPRRYNQRWSEI